MTFTNEFFGTFCSITAASASGAGGRLVRGVCGTSHDLTIRMSETYAEALYRDPVATLDDLRKAVNMLEDVELIARRVFGGAHPLTRRIERQLQAARAALRTREESVRRQDSVRSICEAVEQMSSGSA